MKILQDVLNLPSHFFASCRWCEKLYKNYPKIFVALVYSFLLLCVVYYYGACYPRYVIQSYLLALNHGDFETAHGLLSPKFAHDWPIDKMRSDYQSFVHENIRISRPDGWPNFISPLLCGETLCKTVLDYHVTLKHNDDFAGKYHECFLWGQLYDPKGIAAWEWDPQPAPVEVRVVNERKFHLILSKGLWRIEDFNTRLSDGLRWTQ